MTLYDTSWTLVDEIIDDDGRFCLVVLSKFDTNYIFINLYAPNNFDLNFFTQIFNLIIETHIKYPNSHSVMAGDFNCTLNTNDSVNRQTSQNELQCRNFIKRNLERLDMIDSYRTAHGTGGFTWFRGSCMSRLDLILTTKPLSDFQEGSSIDWAFDDSDHALLKSEFKIPESFRKGPGLIRVDSDILDHPEYRLQIQRELDIQISQIPISWDPHFKWEFVKSALRGIIGNLSGKKRKLDNLDEQSVNEQLNTLISVKEKLERGELTNQQLLTEVNNTIGTLENEKKVFLDNHSKRLSLRAQAKWYEEGERSNKYFLNIIKKRSQQKLITNLDKQGTPLTKQQEIMTHVTDFYSALYDKKDTDDDYDELLSDLPTLNQEDRNMLDAEITLDELRRVLNGCGESAPGPDGIPYKIYRILWQQIGQILLDSWKYSLIKGHLPDDQKLSVITLLPKSGKDLIKKETKDSNQHSVDV